MSNEKTKRKIRELLINLSLAASVSLLLFVVAEISCRLFYDESVNYEEGVWKGLQELNPSFFKESYRNDTYANPSDGLMYNLDDNVLNEEHYTLFDSYEIKKEKEQGKYRIAVLGDSFATGAGLPNLQDSVENRFSTQLGEMLNKEEVIKIENDIKEFEVLLFADGGLNTYQELMLLKNIALSYHLDLVILQYTDNDIGLPRTELGFDKSKLYISSLTNLLFIDDKIVPALPRLNEKISRTLLKKSAFLRFVSYKLNIVLIENASEEWYNLNLDSMKEMSEILKKNNISFIVINFPPALRREEYRCGRVKNNQEIKGFHDKLKEITAGLDIAFFNMCDYIDDIYSIKSEIENDEHYNKEGYRIAAEILRGAVLNKIIEKEE